METPTQSSLQNKSLHVHLANLQAIRHFSKLLSHAYFQLLLADAFAMCALIGSALA